MQPGTCLYAASLLGVYSGLDRFMVAIFLHIFDSILVAHRKRSTSNCGWVPNLLSKCLHMYTYPYGISTCQSRRKSSRIFPNPYASSTSSSSSSSFKVCSSLLCVWMCAPLGRVAFAKLKPNKWQKSLRVLFDPAEAVARSPLSQIAVLYSFMSIRYIVQ